MLEHYCRLQHAGRGAHALRMFQPNFHPCKGGILLPRTTGL